MIGFRLAAAAALSCAAMLLSGCYSNEEIQEAEKVVTALPSEVEGCRFVRDIDTAGAYATIGQARFLLKRQAATDGATHIVETHAWPGLVAPRLVGVGLSAREYVCPEGKGPLKASPQAELNYEIPSYDILFPDDEIFGDGLWAAPPMAGFGFHHFGPPPRRMGPPPHGFMPPPPRGMMPPPGRMGPPPMGMGPPRSFGPRLAPPHGGAPRK
ncbi:MAG: hypothetical protein ACI4NA_03195 [Succinivibrio sp.]